MLAGVNDQVLYHIHLTEDAMKRSDLHEIRTSPHDTDDLKLAVHSSLFTIPQSLSVP